MDKKLMRIMFVAITLCFVLTTISYSANGETTGQKAKTFWQKLFNYPANVTQKSATVVAETGKRGTAVVTNEVKTVGQVTSGEFGKTKDMVTDPFTGTADTAVKAVQETAAIPVDSAKEEAPKANKCN